MDFKQEDRDMLIRHDQKLKTICNSIKELKDDNKEFRHEIKTGFNKITDKLDESTSGCANNRVECRKEIDGNIISRRVLMFILSFIIIGVISIGAYTGGLSTKVAVNTEKIETLQEK